MALILDPNTLEMIQLSEDTEQPAVLCENFRWLLDNLAAHDKNHPVAKNPEPDGGKRRMNRGDAGPNLGYTYFTHAEYNEFASKPDTNITNKGIITINSFGYPVNVERWEVNAPWPVTDQGVKETYFGPGGRKSPGGGPYVCLITARADLRDKKKTRCYVSCNCKDFKYSFLHDLKDKKYTDPNATVEPQGHKTKKDGTPYDKVPQSAAICKHIYAILKQFYGKFIADESGPIENPELYADQKPEAPEEPFKITPYPKPKQVQKPKPTPAPIKKVVPILPPGKKPKPPTKTELKLVAKDEIIVALQDADNTMPSGNIDSYLDPRKFSKSKNAALNYHKYKFAVRVEEQGGHASIYYMNPVFAGSTSGQKILTIPGRGKKDSYYLFTPKELHELVVKYTTPMSDDLQDKLEDLRTKGKIVVYFESVIQYTEEMQILNESSSIMKSLMELKFRVNKCL